MRPDSLLSVAVVVVLLPVLALVAEGVRPCVTLPLASRLALPWPLTAAANAPPRRTALTATGNAMRFMTSSGRAGCPAAMRPLSPGGVNARLLRAGHS
jgi:hypothetical protein